MDLRPPADREWRNEARAIAKVAWVRLGRFSAALLGALICASLLAATASAVRPLEITEPPSFELQGSNGYTIDVSAATPGPTGFGLNPRHGRIYLSAGRGNDVVFYSAPAKVTATSIHADLGMLGRVDLALHKSGLEKTVRIKCFRHSETYEPATWEGSIDFDGEGGYTRARATQAEALPGLLLLTHGQACGGGGSGESRGPGEPGARLAGVSYADGRTLKFQLNKNRPGGKTIFSASLRERRDGIRISKEIGGVAPTSAFSFDPLLRTATLHPPAPFSGVAILKRPPTAASPLLSGGLKLTFPGRTVSLTGAEVHVSLVHAKLTHGDNGSSGVITAGI
jgi:hypothetical protein